MKNYAASIQKPDVWSVIQNCEVTIEKTRKNLGMVEKYHPGTNGDEFGICHDWLYNMIVFLFGGTGSIFDQLSVLSKIQNE